MDGNEWFYGTMAAVMIGNGLTAVFLYALFWGDAQIRRGKDERDLPLWWFFGAGVPPIIAAVCVWVALY